VVSGQEFAALPLVHGRLDRALAKGGLEHGISKSFRDAFTIDDTSQDPGLQALKEAYLSSADTKFQDPKGRSWFSSFDLPPPPEPGKCNEQACDEDDEDCATRAAQASHYAFWLDGSKLDDGVEHLEEFPKPGPMNKKRGP
jgi:hypothetical protein